MRRSAPFVVVTTLVAVLSVALSACTPSPPPTVSTPTKEKVSAALAPFYHQVLHWSSCYHDMQCTKATAPLNWSDPSQGKIKLALIRKVASGDRLGSLLVNPGGPGGSGFDFVKDSLDYAVDDTLQSHFDIVGFDPRGVGRSSAVACYGPEKMDDYLYGIVPGTPGSDAWIAAQTRAATEFGAACAENTGPLLAHVGTASAARDLDLLRAVLGDKKLNYLGYSYGTFLGAVYAKLYPHKAGRLVLDGALDPAASNFEVTKMQAKGFEDALRAYLKHCLGQKDCPFHGSVDRGMKTIAQLLASVQTSPILNDDGRQLGSSTLLTAIIYPLYDANAWNYLSQMFVAVMHGDASLAFRFADTYNDRKSDGTYTTNSTEAFMAINCLDYTYNADPAVMRAQAAELQKVAPVIGQYMAYGDIGCANWPYVSKVQRGPISAPGAAPILVIGTTGDPATPYAWAKNLSRELDSGYLVTYHGEGHTAYNKSNSCVNNTVDDYFVHGTVPKDDPNC